MIGGRLGMGGVAGACPEVGAGPGLTDLVVAMHQDNAEVGGLESAPALHDHVVALADVVDVHGDAGVRPWAQHGLSSPSTRAMKPASQPRPPGPLAGLPRTVPRTRRGGSEVKKLGRPPLTSDECDLPSLSTPRPTAHAPFQKQGPDPRTQSSTAKWVTSTWQTRQLRGLGGPPDRLQGHF